MPPPSALLPISSLVNLFLIALLLLAVPLAAPQNVRAETRSATEIQVSWDPPPSDAQNGEMLGYKIFFWPSGHRDSAELLAVAPSDRTAILNGLQMFTEYASVVLAFNAAGDGPNSTVPVVARTSEGGQ